MMDKFKISRDYELTGVKKRIRQVTKKNILKMVQTYLSLPVNKHFLCMDRNDGAK